MEGKGTQLEGSCPVAARPTQKADSPRRAAGGLPRRAAGEDPYGTAYTWGKYKITNRMMWQIREYIDNHQWVGGFLTAVVRNDLREAVMTADDENLPNLPAFVAYFYNHAPMACWGSFSRVEEWLQPHGANDIKDSDGPAAARPTA